MQTKLYMLKSKNKRVMLGKVQSDIFNRNDVYLLKIKTLNKELPKGERITTTEMFVKRSTLQDISNLWDYMKIMEV